jgi:hypothetical protein
MPALTSGLPYIGSAADGDAERRQREHTSGQCRTLIWRLLAPWNGREEHRR